MLGKHRFDLNTIHSMSKAFEGVLIVLGLSDSHDLRSLVADKVVELAQQGEHDADRLTAAVLKAFRN